ncbi:DsrE family protein [Acidithiobacillus ferrianus]|uniref:DsrE family protein n=2 Tax=Acidithiobacillus ferrianus TaxID=2678518 RepID=A0A845U5I5_9PROT|nr:DsrE family protein [Acidithiobacillus ferrianus]NDU42556.1 hypothetical protein [Acidithiobacillus ferrianus]
MKRSIRISIMSVVTTCFLLGGIGVADANPSMLKGYSFAKPTFVHEHPFATAHIVLQVSQGDPARWGLALSNAQNLLNYFGQEEVQIVIVAFGPGEKMYLADSPVAEKIAALDAEGVEFDACDNTYKAMTKEMGHPPKLVKQAVIVPGGIVRIMQLEQHGFDYIKP